MVLQRRQELELVRHVKQVDQSVPAATGEVISSEVQAHHLRVMGLYGADGVEVVGVVDPDVAGPVPADEVLAVRTDPDTADPGPLALRRVEMESVLRETLHPGPEERALVQAPHSDGVVIPAGHQAGPATAGTAVTLQAPDAGGVETLEGEQTAVVEVGEAPESQAVVSVDDGELGGGLVVTHG